MTITISKEKVIAQGKPRYNTYQGGNGVHVSAKYKGRKSKVGQKIKNEMRNYF